MALIKKQFQIEPTTRPGKTGQFDVIANGQTIAERGGNWITRKFGAGYPDFDVVMKQLQEMNRNS